MKAIGVANPSVLDVMTYDPASNQYVLIMIENRSWDGTAERVLQLQSKINFYLTYAFDGQMQSQYPESASASLRLQLDCNQPPDARTAEFIEAARARLALEGVQFVVRVVA